MFLYVFFPFHFKCTEHVASVRLYHFHLRRHPLRSIKTIFSHLHHHLLRSIKTILQNNFLLFFFSFMKFCLMLLDYKYPDVDLTQEKSASGLPQWQPWPDETGSGKTTPSASQASSSCARPLSHPFFCMALRDGLCLLTVRKGQDPGFQNQVPDELSPYLLLGIQDQQLGARDGNLNGRGVPYAMTACPKPSLRAPWKEGSAVVSRGYAGWTMSKT